LSAPEAPAAGWYADPHRQAQQRYWDGSAWTGYTSDVPPDPISAPPAPDAAMAAGPLASVGARLGNRRLILIFAGVLAVVLVVSVLAVVALAPRIRQPDCDPDRPCGSPPTGSPALSVGTVYESPDLGFRLEYDDEIWDRADQDGRSVTLRFTGTDAVLEVGGAPADEATPESLLEGQFDSLGERVQSLTVDSDPTHKILGPRVGFRDAIGGAYTGVSDTPQGPSQPISLVVMAARDDEIATYLTVLTSEEDSGAKPVVYEEVDAVMNTMRYPSELE
jgi:uncharacterized protein DUF2510